MTTIQRMVSYLEEIVRRKLGTCMSELGTRALKVDRLVVLRAPPASLGSGPLMEVDEIP
jgi:hypothetical protein